MRPKRLETRNSLFIQSKADLARTSTPLPSKHFLTRIGLERRVNVSI
jgi:hypothetical protein